MTRLTRIVHQIRIGRGINRSDSLSESPTLRLYLAKNHHLFDIASRCEIELETPAVSTRQEVSSTSRAKNCRWCRRWGLR